jgi:magnesium transporter
MDVFDDYIFVVLKMVYPDVSHEGIQYEQVSLIIGSNYVISLQEVEEDIFDPVRERIRQGKGRIRRQGSDYLAYSLTDMVVDQYFRILEDLGEQIETLQDAVIEDPDPSSPGIIQNLKREILFLRKSVWPLREIINALTRGESDLIRSETVLFLRDVYDHTIQIIDTIETFRDMLSGTLDIYLSNVSNRMNEVMKVLTIMATIFIPMTFVAGIYGMNFKYMPELEWPWSYPAVWLVLVVMFVSMVIWFKRKKWF